MPDDQGVVDYVSLYRPYSGPADTTLEDCLMDNVLLFSYFVFMIMAMSTSL